MDRDNIQTTTVSPFDAFIVVKVSDGKAIEGHATLGAANRAAHVLNFHNEQFGHAERFKVVPRSEWEG